MRHNIILFFAATLLVGCVSQSKYDLALKESNDKINALRDSVSSLTHTVTVLRDSVSILSYPADQRYAAIDRLISEGQLEKAKREIRQLNSIFPNSTEASKTTLQLALIEKKEAAIKAEQERIKAQGFKTLKENSTVSLGSKTCSFSSFSYGRTFSFDYCSDVDEYWYRTADKSNTYILASMSMSTKENYASTPTIVPCEIRDGKLHRIGYFSCEYASWSSYGAKIGNYSDTSHDFSKVNSVRYKVGAEISLEESKKPIVIVVAKDGESYSDGMTPQEAAEKLIVIKILNKNLI